MEKNSNVPNIKMEEDAINDAIFYRDVNYVIYIPDNFREDFLDNKSPEIQIKSTGDYNASLAEMMIQKYIQTATIYIHAGLTEEEIIANVNDTLSKETEIEITSKLDTDGLINAGFYFNFANYSILAGVIYVICLITFIFKTDKISKRTNVSSMSYKKLNRILLLSNGLFAIFMWFLYVVIGIILMGNILFTSHGLIFIINSFFFTLCSLTLAFLLSIIMKTKETVNSIINVIALGSSFLCGAFVPAEFLPDSVLTIAHVLPSYWYIQTNDVVKKLETINFETLYPVFINISVLVGFSVLFIVIANVVSKKKLRN
jgi:ABC-2 type transport system permease protein